MKRMRLGSTNEYLTVVGLGTWEMGGGITPDFSRDDESVEAIRKAVKLGITHIDTAEYYGNGHTEEIVGRALKEINRDEVFITSKVWPNHLKLDDAVDSIERTLKRLGTDRVDLYLVHWPSTELGMEEVMETMNTLLEKGYTRYIGVSNFSIEQLKEAVKFSKAPIVCDQVLYNMDDRSVEREGLLDFCKENDVSIVAYSPLNRMSIDYFVRRKLKKVASKRNAAPSQIALAWLAKKGVFSIPKAVKEKHLKENAEAGEMVLSDEEMKELDG